MSKKFSLDAILALPEEDKADAISEMASVLIAEGTTEAEIEEVERLIEQLNALIGQRMRPN